MAGYNWINLHSSNSLLNLLKTSVCCNHHHIVKKTHFISFHFICKCKCSIGTSVTSCSCCKCKLYVTNCCTKGAHRLGYIWKNLSFIYGIIVLSDSLSRLYSHGLHLGYLLLTFLSLRRFLWQVNNRES